MYKGGYHKISALFRICGEYFFKISYRVECYLGGHQMRQVVIHPGEDGYWVAECPSLPGCISQGATRDEAIRNIKEAIGAYVEALEADHLPVPPETFETLLVAV
jgi:predicted RNase H-like HicB family nuclease